MIQKCKLNSARARVRTRAQAVAVCRRGQDKKKSAGRTWFAAQEVVTLLGHIQSSGLNSSLVLTTSSFFGLFPAGKRVQLDSFNHFSTTSLTVDGSNSVDDKEEHSVHKEKKDVICLSGDSYIV